VTTVDLVRADLWEKLAAPPPDAPPPALACRRVKHRYANSQSDVLHGVSLDLLPGECGVLMGPSGSGKTTLLSVLGCLLTPTAGQVTVAGRPITPDSDLPAVRRSRLGFVFQHAQLVPFLTVGENLELVGKNAGLPRGECRRRTDDLLKVLGLPGANGKWPHQLSGGQRQRVAVARALLHRPAVVLADEPTAALDWPTAQAVMRLLIDHATQTGAAVLVVTHDVRLSRWFERRFEMHDGDLHEV
jgi:ABC-type lipoprotein export system ATPase subunit